MGGYGKSAKVNVDGFVDWALEELRKRRGRMRSDMEEVAQAGIAQMQLEIDEAAFGSGRQRGGGRPHSATLP